MNTQFLDKLPLIRRTLIIGTTYATEQMLPYLLYFLFPLLYRRWLENENHDMSFCGPSAKESIEHTLEIQCFDDYTDNIFRI